ncbi:hypothetical protein [Pseudoalteromonas ulvae]|uniref:hypothetical protein n=1 Tax=Pseudoalteromonas ulvae TaxID=107327 RepID=UPI0015945E0C|nr:hypothetical protein [Pseudoalteromonas ulvae]
MERQARLDAKVLSLAQGQGVKVGCAGCTERDAQVMDSATGVAFKDATRTF